MCERLSPYHEDRGSYHYETTSLGIEEVIRLKAITCDNSEARKPPTQYKVPTIRECFSFDIRCFLSLLTPRLCADEVTLGSSGCTLPNYPCVHIDNKATFFSGRGSSGGNGPSGKFHVEANSEPLVACKCFCRLAVPSMALPGASVKMTWPKPKPGHCKGRSHLRFRRTCEKVDPLLRGRIFRSF